jgi:ABC-2 type transport system permease protein
VADVVDAGVVEPGVSFEVQRRRTLREWLHLYWVLSWARVRADWQYRVSFVLFTITQFFITFLDFVLIIVVFQRVPTLSGWSLAEVALLYGITGVAFFVSDVFVSQVERVDEYVRSGRFDSLLVRPLGPLFQLSTEEFALRRFGKLAQGTIVLGIALASLDLHWTLARMLVLMSAIASGTVIFSAIWIAGVALTFWAVDAQEVVNSFTYGGNYASQYPLRLFAPWLRRMMTFLVPTAFVSYFPALYVLGRDSRADMFGLPSWVRFLSPVVALACAGVARVLWHAGIRHYRSTGS